MVEAGWLDLDSRKGKAPRGYQATFEETRRPFIFKMPSASTRRADPHHEAGHAFHAVAPRRTHMTYATAAWRWPMCLHGNGDDAQDYLDLFLPG